MRSSARRGRQGIGDRVRFYLHIGGRRVGTGEPAYLVAEMSANHGGSLDRSPRILDAAVKLQTYTADTMTLDSDAEAFRIRGTPWSGRSLHDLYAETATPRDWHPRLKEHAARSGSTCSRLRSTPRRSTSSRT